MLHSQWYVMFYTQRQKGFTLIEMAIILAIIGFIASGVVGGRILLENRRLNQIVDDTSRINEAVTKFEKLYGGKPGDLWNASEKLGAGAINGDGNGRINDIAGNTDQERYAFWQHLSMAGLIEGKYSGTGPTPIPGVNVPKTPRPELYYWADSDTLLGADAGSPYVITARRTNTGTAGFTPEDAYRLDMKYDDGLPGSGKILSANGSGGAGNCLNGTGYDMTNSSSRCQVVFRVEDGEITETAVVLAPIRCTSPDGIPGERRELGCAAGQSGERYQICNSVGNWVVTDTCTAGSCMLGSVQPIACPAGYNGTAIQTCDASGNWIPDTSTCTPITCPGGANVSDPRTLPCPAGQTGVINEVCSSSGTWVETSRTCVSITCPGGGNPSDTRPATCPAGQTGGVETCQANGSWSVTTACTPITCSGGQTPGQTRTATCPSGETGGIETCQANGTWLITTACTPVAPPPPPAPPLLPAACTLPSNVSDIPASQINQAHTYADDVSWGIDVGYISYILAAYNNVYFPEQQGTNWITNPPSTTPTTSYNGYPGAGSYAEGFTFNLVGGNVASERPPLYRCEADGRWTVVGGKTDATFTAIGWVYGSPIVTGGYVPLCYGSPPYIATPDYPFASNVSGRVGDTRAISCPAGQTGGVEQCVYGAPQNPSGSSYYIGEWRTIRGCVPDTGSACTEGAIQTPVATAPVTMTCPAGNTLRRVQKCVSGSWVDQGYQCGS